MRYVIDASIIRRWYLPDEITSQALELRTKLIFSGQELIATDNLLVEATQFLSQAEKSGSLTAGKMLDKLEDLQTLGVIFYSSIPLLERAGQIALTTKLQVVAGLCVALAEQERCQVLTTNTAFLRAARKQFPFVVDLASLP